MFRKFIGSIISLITSLVSSLWAAISSIWAAISSIWGFLSTAFAAVWAVLRPIDVYIRWLRPSYSWVLVTLRWVVNVALGSIWAAITRTRSSLWWLFDFVFYRLPLWIRPYLFGWIHSLFFRWILPFFVQEITDHWLWGLFWDLKKMVEDQIRDLRDNVWRLIENAKRNVEAIFQTETEKVIREVERQIEMAEKGHRVYWWQLKDRVNWYRYSAPYRVKRALRVLYRDATRIIEALEDRKIEEVRRQAEKIRQVIIIIFRRRGIFWRLLSWIPLSLLKGVEIFCIIQIRRVFYRAYDRIDEVYWGIVQWINRALDRVIVKIGEWELRMQDVIFIAETIIGLPRALHPQTATMAHIQNIPWQWMVDGLISGYPTGDMNPIDELMMIPMWGILNELQELKAACADLPTTVTPAIHNALGDIVGAMALTEEEGLALWPDQRRMISNRLEEYRNQARREWDEYTAELLP